MSEPAATSFSPGELRERLAALTLRDEHRLGRRLQRLGADPAADALTGLAAEVERATARLERRRALVPDPIEYPPELPVSARRDDLLAAIRDHQVTVVAGETGSGKTTQLPKVCLELGRGVRGGIAHTQPRRLAARTVAARIAEELGVPLGEAVGYAVRFDDRSSQDSLVRLMTDGLLLAEVQHDRLLRRYDTIIVDEAHERSLNVDFLLGVLHQLLPRRPDLKLVITSATIDPGRFAAHFHDAPVVEVSGRTYPVEVRYREAAEDEDPDLGEQIGDAVEELQREGPGDVLVFLSGEREIRDVADTLTGRLRDAEVLPLYARLATHEQNRVWQPSDGRRVVLATNVAETSLTVPGIRYVVDAGTARISRYSARLKVQRLPIEKVSQASADQRKGRCGRVADGICIRLYSAEDFEARPRFTDPEVLRTNLASVILQMAALKLGDVEAFPFLDPPDRRQVRDGVNLLHELGALHASPPTLTDVGRRLSRLPVDPRLGRMVLAAGPLRCVEEVVVIVAALSIQDPRERPQDERAQADQQHARFVGEERSDFLAYVNLWRYLRGLRDECSGNQFRKRVRAEYLHYLRVREWQDLAGQLRRAAREVGLELNDVPAEPDAIHQALLTGLLSHIGLHDKARREYQGARNARFSVFPGSALARRSPPWVMVAELVETSRLFGRTAARIEPRWIEPAAGHLLKRTYDAPRWSRQRGAAVVTERVTLYGLPIVAGRQVALAPLDAAAARDVFIRSALVEGDWDSRHPFVQANAERIAEVRALQDRMRRMDLLVSDEERYRFFDARLPATVVSARHLDRWLRDAGQDALTFDRADLIDPAAAATLDDRARPTEWKQGDLRLRLTYAFDPGAARDGVTVHVPLGALADLRPDGFDWLVPALREELVTALLRALPKELRRPLVPMPETAARVTASLEPRKGPIVAQVARLVEATRGVRVDPAVWDDAALAPHLRMTFAVEDADGTPLASGQDLEAVRAAVRPRLRAALERATAAYVRTGLRAWPADLPQLPREVAAAGTRAFLALAAEDGADATVGVAAFETAEAAAAAMRAGTRRLLALTVPSPAKRVADKLPAARQLQLATAPHGSAQALLDDAAGAAIDVLADAAGGPAWTAEDFAVLRQRVAGRLEAGTSGVLGRVLKVLDAGAELREALDALRGPAVQAAKLDVEAQRDRLLRPGLATAFGADRLPDVERYLRGAASRLRRLATDVAGDRDRQRAITPLEATLDARGLGPEHPAFWAVQELRIAQFAQGLGVHGQVSARRVRRLLDG